MMAILGLLGAVAAIGGIIWRITIAVQAAREVADVAKGVANMPRKMRFKARANKENIKLVDDPREAAAVLMLGLAKAGGEITREEKDEINAQMARAFQISTADADEFSAQAAWRINALPDPADAIRRMSGVVTSACTAQEVQDLDAMLRAVAEAGGQPNPEQVAFLARWREASGAGAPAQS